MDKQSRQGAKYLHRMALLCIFLACLGANWFTYQFYLVPQPKSYAPSWGNARWIEAAGGAAPVSYFRYATTLNDQPDGAFVTIAASQVFRLYVNGFYVGSNSSDFRRGNIEQAYMYDVTSILKVGQNVVAIRVGNDDQRPPSVVANFGVDHGNSVALYGTGKGWVATSDSSAVYSHDTDSTGKANSWTDIGYSSTPWAPALEATAPQLSTVLTANPLIYELPNSLHWISTGGGHDAYFVRQLSLPDGTTGAWLRIVATGTANVYINGKLYFVWNGAPLAHPTDLPHYLTDRERIIHYQSGLALGVYDISLYVHPGINTIAVHVLTPGVSGALSGLDNLNASLSLDFLYNDAQNHPNLLDTPTGWHASRVSAPGWEQGNSASLSWASAISISRPGPSHLFYVPYSETQRSSEFVSLPDVAKVLLCTTGLVLGLWFLVSLGLVRRYCASIREALDVVSLAYLPALVCEAALLILSREPLIPRPFPYTGSWGGVLVFLVLLGYLLIWLSTRMIQKRTSLSDAYAVVRFAPLAPQFPLIGAWVGSTQAHLSKIRSGKHGRWSLITHHSWLWLREHWALIPIIVIAFPLITYNLTYDPYWQDELTSFLAAKGILAHGIPALPSGFIYTKGELYSYMLALSTKVFGEQGGAPRLISITEYLLSLPLLYCVGCYFFDRRVAWLATAMLAFSPMALSWGREVRMYEQAQFITILVIYLFYKTMDESAPIWLIYAAIGSLVLDYLSHEEVFIIFPGLVLWVVVLSRDKKHRYFAVLRNKHWWIAGTIGASVIVLQLLAANLTHPPILGTDSSQRPYIQFATDGIPYYIKLMFFPLALPHSQGQPLITLDSALAALGSFWAFRRSDGRAKYCAWFLLVGFFTLVFLFTLRSDRYIYTLLPIYYLMGSYAALIILRTMWSFARTITLRQQLQSTGSLVGRPSLVLPMKIILGCTTSVACFCLLALPALPIADFNYVVSRQFNLSYFRHHPDYDNAGQYVQQHWKKGDIVISLSPAISVLYYVGHIDYFFSVDHALYLFERDGHIVDTPTGSTPILSQSDFKSVLDTHARIWVIAGGANQNLPRIRGKAKFIFPPDFHLVYEGYDSYIYLRGS